MRSLLVASNRLFQTRVLPGWPPPWGQEGLGGGGGGRGGGSIHPWPSGLKAQPGFPRALASRRPLGAWQWLGTRANPAGRRPATGRRPSREEACITLLRIASRGVAAQPSKKKLFVLRPSSLVFVLVDLVVLRIHVRRITARGACSSEVAVDAAPLLLDRVVSIVPSSLSILHLSLSLSPSLSHSVCICVYV